MRQGCCPKRSKNAVCAAMALVEAVLYPAPAACPACSSPPRTPCQQQRQASAARWYQVVAEATKSRPDVAAACHGRRTGSARRYARVPSRRHGYQGESQHCFAVTCVDFGSAGAGTLPRRACAHRPLCQAHSGGLRRRSESARSAAGTGSAANVCAGSGSSNSFARPKVWLCVRIRLLGASAARMSPSDRLRPRRGGGGGGRRRRLRCVFSRFRPGVSLYISTSQYDSEIHVP